MRKIVITAIVLLLVLTFGNIVSAHVTVQPGSVPANSYQVFTLRVPTEKETATTKVKVEIPAEVEVSRFEPKPDWTYEIEKNADGKIVSVTWSATGSGFGATEFGQFNFQGKVAEDAKELVWKAHQTYADGSVVDWTGAADSKKPASVTQVTAATGDGHGHGTAADPAADDEKEGGISETLTLIFSAAALVVSLAALFVALRKKA